MEVLLQPFLAGLSEDATVSEIDSSLPEQWTQSSGQRHRQLLFDRLLELASVDPALYPPRDYPALRSLVQAVQDSDSFDALKKNCLLYYLLKDYRDDREKKFANAARNIPRRFQTIQDTYWLLDNAEYEAGVKKLCSPGLTPDFVPDILNLLSASLPQDRSSTLICNLVALLDPACLADNLSQADVQLIVNALLYKERPAEALAWMRRAVADFVSGLLEDMEEEAKFAKQEEKRAELVKAMMEYCFTSDPPLSGTLEALLYLPFNLPGDFAVLNWLAASSTPSSKLPPNTVSLVNEWATSRLVSQGRYVEAIALLSTSLNNLKTSTEAYQKAQKAKKEMYDVLPPVQRAMVDVQSGQSRSKSAAESAGNSVTITNGTSVNGDGADSVSGAIARLPWLPAPALPTLPNPTSLSEARSNAAVLKTLRAGGPMLSAKHDLPMSASGLLRKGGKAGVSVGKDAKRDERVELLRAVQRGSASGSQTPKARQDSGPASPYTAAAPGTPSRQLSQNEERERRRAESPFSASSSVISFQQQQQTYGQQGRATVQGYGLVRPQVQQYQQQRGIDFSEQLKRHRAPTDNSQNRGEDSNGQDISSGRAEASTSANTKPRSSQQEIEQNSERQRSQKASSQRSSAPRAALPGAFGPHSDEEDDDNDTAHDAMHEDDRSDAGDRPAAKSEGSAPPARSTRASARTRREGSTLEPLVEDEQLQASKDSGKGSKRRTRTKSQNRETSNPAPSKKGRTARNTATSSTPRRSARQQSMDVESQQGDEEGGEENIAQPTPRRSSRLGSAAPSEQGGDDDDSAVDDTFVAKKSAPAKTPRRRRP